MVKRIAAVLAVTLVAFAPTASAETLRDRCRDSVWRVDHWSQCRQFYGNGDPFSPVPGGGGDGRSILDRILDGLGLGGIL